MEIKIFNKRKSECIQKLQNAYNYTNIDQICFETENRNVNHIERQICSLFVESFLSTDDSSEFCIWASLNNDSLFSSCYHDFFISSPRRNITQLTEKREEHSTNTFSSFLCGYYVYFQTTCILSSVFSTQTSSFCNLEKSLRSLCFSCPYKL